MESVPRVMLAALMTTAAAGQNAPPPVAQARGHVFKPQTVRAPAQVPVRAPAQVPGFVPIFKPVATPVFVPQQANPKPFKPVAGRVIPVQQPQFVQRAQPVPFENVILTTSLPRTGPASLAAFANLEIALMQQVCKLTDAQTKTLRIAAKGVAYRLKRQAEQQREQQKKLIAGIRGARFRGVQQFEVGFRMQPVDNSAAYRVQLNGHAIWRKAVKRVLTPEQQMTWSTTGLFKTGRQP